MHLLKELCPVVPVMQKGEEGGGREGGGREGRGSQDGLIAVHSFYI